MAGFAPPLVLGLESSCDETAAALVDASGRVLAERVASQEREHARFGGVVPELAARAHLALLPRLVAACLEEAGQGPEAIGAVAATSGPGLIGGLIVGACFGKGLAVARGVPFLAINHLEAHALTPRLPGLVPGGAPFPYLLLLVSGGHTLLASVEGVGRYRRLGSTMDDAVGEAFDKVAKLLGLGWPGGPAVEKLATAGDPRHFALPRPMKGRANCDFSFSGLKTAVAHLVAGFPPGPLPARDAADIAASFQEAVAETLADRVRQAARRFKAGLGGGGRAPGVPGGTPDGTGGHAPVLVVSGGVAPGSGAGEQVAAAGRAPGVPGGTPDGTGGHAPVLVVSGGVAANAKLRAALAEAAAAEGFTLAAPPLRLCTDNAVMVAWAGQERLRLGLTADGLGHAPRPRWPLESLGEAEGT